MDAPYGNMEDGKARFDMVVGIMSFGYEGGDADQISGDKLAIYTNVDYFLDWIEWITDSHRDVRSEGRVSCYSSSVNACSVRKAQTRGSRS